MYVHATFFSWTYIADIEQILSEAQHQWLRPVEICEILRNYTKFCIASETGNRPPNGSLFLFDRKRKKKDGKTVKEAHERLKVGSIDVLHCYYAHGKENENFQRCSYWLLEENANLWSCFVVYDNFCCYTHRILQCTECLQRCTVKKGKHAKLLKCSIRH